MFRTLFDETSSQSDVYKTVAAPLVTDFLDGYNGTIFAYGQTGSGKTYTMSGGGPSWEDRGIIPRVFTHLF
jgi:kinesin family protein 6/9